MVGQARQSRYVSTASPTPLYRVCESAETVTDSHRKVGTVASVAEKGQFSDETPNCEYLGNRWTPSDDTGTVGKP